MTQQKPVLVCIVGPTAIGKTRMAIALAKAFNTEIISADSRQFFKEMRIGTAVPTIKELQAAPHHFIQHISIHEHYSVGAFEREAMDLLKKLFEKHGIVIMVGGSGLYVDAISKGLDSFPKVKPGIRNELNREFEEHGIEPLQKELQKRDPDYYQEVDLQNPQRVIRALEVCRSSGSPFSSFRNTASNPRFFTTIYIGLDASRELIYERINHRVDLMMEEGLLEEAKNLFPNRDLNALQTVGYKELFAHLEGQCSLEEAVAEIKKNTRRFAKRQGTWFRKNQEITWFPYDAETEEIVRFIKKPSSQKG